MTEKNKPVYPHLMGVEGHPCCKAAANGYCCGCGVYIKKDLGRAKDYDKDCQSEP